MAKTTMPIGLHMCGWGAGALPGIFDLSAELNCRGVELVLAPLEDEYGESALAEMCATHAGQIAPVACVMWNSFAAPDAFADSLAVVRRHCAWAKKWGAKGVIFFPAEGTPEGYDSKTKDRIYQAFEQVGDLVLAAGLTPLYHNHYRVSHSFSRDLLADDMANIDWHKWKLCVDTAHLVLALNDPVTFIRKHIDRVGWFHCKDIRNCTFTDIDGVQGMAAVAHEITEVGKGVVDFATIITVLREANYAGWLVIEQDRSETTPQESARISVEYLQNLLASGDGSRSQVAGFSSVATREGDKS